MLACKEVCDTLNYLLDNRIIRFGSKLYRHGVGISMVLIVLLYSIFHEKNFMLFLSDNLHVYVFEALNSNYLRLDDLSNIDNP